VGGVTSSPFGQLPKMIRRGVVTAPGLNVAGIPKPLTEPPSGVMTAVAKAVAAAGGPAASAGVGAAARAVRPSRPVQARVLRVRGRVVIGWLRGQWVGLVGDTGGLAVRFSRTATLSG